MPKPWRSVETMTRADLAEEVVKLRSENTSLRKWNALYRGAVEGARGAAASLQSILALSALASPPADPASTDIPPGTAAGAVERSPNA